MLTWLGRLRDWQFSLTVEDGGLGCPRGPEVVTVTAWWVGGSRRDRLHRGRRSRPTWQPIPRGPPTREGARNSGSWRLSSRRRRRHTRPSHLRSCSGPDRPRGGHRHREQGRRSGACGPRMTKPRMATADRAVRCSRLARQDTAHPGWTVLRSGEVTVHPRPLRLSDRSPAGKGPNVPNRRPGDHSRPDVSPPAPCTRPSRQRWCASMTTRERTDARTTVMVTSSTQRLMTTLSALVSAARPKVS